MKPYILYLILLVLITGCKARYTELSRAYERTRQRMEDNIRERKKLEKQLPALRDSIAALQIQQRVWKKYYLQSAEILRYKKSYLQHGQP